MADILRSFANKAGENFNDSFVYMGEEDHNNIKCYKIIMKNNQFKYVDYQVKKGETMMTIARKLKVGEYMILENNPKHSGYGNLKEGEVIKVPTGYAKNVTLFIDKLYYIPIGIKVEDDKGLYEQYEYFFLQYNPKISDEEFTKTYKDYKFWLLIILFNPEHDVYVQKVFFHFALAVFCSNTFLFSEFAPGYLHFSQ